VLAEALADADATGQVDWRVSADSTVVRAHQHATNAARDNEHERVTQLLIDFFAPARPTGNG
jgi:hypothetical protein